jgi:nicotinate phosphoribosyltransferase
MKPPRSIISFEPTRTKANLQGLKETLLSIVFDNTLLNIFNFESLITTKAFRIKLISKQTTFSDFDLQSQSFGILHTSRAAFTGGATSTSNIPDSL